MLPSQSARSASHRAHMYRRGGSRRWLAVIGIVVLVLGAVIAIRWLANRGEPANADANVASNSKDAAPAGAGAAPPKVADAGTPRGGGKPNLPAQPNPGSGDVREQEKISMGGTTGGKPGGETKAPPTQEAGSSPPSREAAAPIVQPPVTPPMGSETATPAPPPPPLARVDPAAPTPSTLNTNNQPSTTPSNAPANTPSNAGAQQRINLGLELIKQNKPIEARRTLSEALATAGISPADAERVRSELTKLNDRLVFSPEVVAGDPFVATHTIESGDSLAKLPRKLDLDIDWRFLQRINRISDPTKIQAGQRIKTVKGPFHAVVDKRVYRMDLYLGDGSDRVYVRSFSVGLGEYGATPEGAFVVKPNSKLVNPAWTNPRTGENFTADDPKNPLGEYWIGLVGASDNIRGLESYGIHGTIEAESIGQERSMGCVRMLADDIKLVYEVLMDNASRVEIHGHDWP